MCAPVMLADTVTVGTPDAGGNAYPIGAPAGTLFPYNGEYQQLYDSSAFSGPFTITSIGFESSSMGQELLNATISLSTSPQTLTTLSNIYSANIGADDSQVFSGMLPVMAIANGSFDLNIPLMTPFAYDPSAGDLLLDVVVNSNTSPVSKNVFFEATNDAITSRAFNGGGSGPVIVEPDYGLVTEFSSTPEPSTIAFCLLGLGIGLLARSLAAPLRRDMGTRG